MKEIVTKDGRKLRRISRWIKIQQNYNPSKRNALWDYVTDGYGYHPYQDKFDPKDGLFLDFFKFRGHTFALEQFYALGSAWVGMAPHMYDDVDGKLGVIGALYMDGPIFGPAMYGEFDECCEHVRLYEDIV